MSDEIDNSENSDHQTAASAGTEASPAADDSLSAQWTTEQVEVWKEKAEKSQDYWERLVRVSADFDNYKKRAARERQEATRFANESLLQKLVPMLDNFEMALAAASNPQSNTADALKTGVTMIQSQLRSALKEAGLEEIDATGQPFDPNWHEAVSQQSSADVPEGHVLQQIRKGYKLNDRLIRPATVIVAKKPAA
jgi:molecular chaperone GrpE